ncbi:hypothetical protein GF339_02055 [candidate division KSB3 bacterium]|uniref:Uncharacterized protein n=1 Tax=candidate division KSB3 bacterium TaxID=2044937 RepID=A0A9D5JSJ6_9BACT|nr:hypothetical protein [candidate division KSB3 bacterium]MBD3323335.1 hypothetical protein [candidate division KSB3 bacterium]
MRKRRTKQTKLSKKTVKTTEAHRERRMRLSPQKSKVNTRDTQVLCYESSMKCILFGKAAS